MHKTILFIVGLIFFLPSASHAECTDGINPAVDAVLGEIISSTPTDPDSITLEDDWEDPPLPPVSDYYTKPVLFRAQLGIQKAESSTATFGGFFSWLSKVFSLMTIPTNVDEPLIHNSRNLQDMSICMRTDLFLLEAMMERVRCKAEFALEEDRFVSILMYEELIDWLGDRYEHLLKGGKVNTLEDELWWQTRWFDQRTAGQYCCDHISQGTCSSLDEDNAVCFGPTFLTLDACDRHSPCRAPPRTWCCGNADNFCEYVLEASCVTDQFDTYQDCIEDDVCEEPDEGEPRGPIMCGYHSDYQAPTAVYDSFIDEETLSYGCDLPTLERISDDGNLVLDDCFIDYVIVDKYEIYTDLFEKRDYVVESGSLLLRNTQSINAWMGIPSPRELTVFGKTREKDKRHQMRVGCDMKDCIKCDEDGDCNTGSCGKLIPKSNEIPPWPLGTIRVEKMGPFSIDTNDIRIFSDAEHVRREWGRNREVPEHYRKQAAGWFTSFINWLSGDTLGEWTQQQEVEDLKALPKGYDSPQIIMGMMMPIRDVVSKFSRLASSASGLREFPLGLAYYIRKSCITRPCNARLDIIMKTALEGSCFPYTDGSFLNTTDLHVQCCEAVFPNNTDRCN